MSGEPVATDIQFFSLTSRIGRLRFLAYNVGLALVATIPLLVCFLIATILPIVGIPIGFLLEIAFIVFNFALMVRRLHDLNRSGWWLLLILVPLVNLIFILYLIFAPGSIGENDYGQQPPPNSTWVVVGAVVYALIMVGGIAAAPAVFNLMESRMGHMQTSGLP